MNRLIRAATIEDVVAMRLILESTDHAWNIDILLDCFNDHYLHWIIELNQKIIGFSVVRTSSQIWEIMFIAIHADYQKKSYGTQLLKYLINAAKLAKIQSLELEVKRSNQAAIALYQKLHFQQVGVRKNYYLQKNGREDAILFDLALKA